MMHPEQERIFDRARLRRERIAVLRRRREIAELRRRIIFGAIWASTRRHAVYDEQWQLICRRAR